MTHDRAAKEGEGREEALDRLDEQWKARCRVLMGDVEKLKRELAAQRAPEPRYQALVRKWREGRVMTNLGIDMQLHGGIGIAKLCADELERLAAARLALP